MQLILYRALLRTFPFVSEEALDKAAWHIGKVGNWQPPNESIAHLAEVVEAALARLEEYQRNDISGIGHNLGPPLDTGEINDARKSARAVANESKQKIPRRVELSRHQSILRGASHRTKTACSAPRSMRSMCWDNYKNAASRST
jgi:hypothetical protein